MEPGKGQTCVGDCPQSLAEPACSARLGSRVASMLCKLLSDRGLPGVQRRHGPFSIGTFSQGDEG